MAKDDKLKALDAAIAQIERQYGKGSVMKLGDNSANMNVETVPTGSLSLDIALGLGGLPKGRIIEIYGPESSGKTTVALHCVAEVQKQGGIAGFIDAEHALDPVYAKNIGVDIDNLYISQPDCGEQALEITETMVRSGAVDIVIVDSVAALVPKAEIDGDMGDSHVGLQARLMSQALRKLTGVISKSNCIVIFINQLREKVGVMFGNPETTTGGRALKFYSSVRLDVRRVEQLKQAGEVIGNHTSSRPEHGDRTCKNFLLPRRTDLNIFRTPLLTCLLIFTKHSLPGTRGIYHDPVKIFRKHSRKCLRTLVCHHHIFYTHPFHILGKNLCPRRMNLIADKEPFSLHRCRNLCTFAPRCRT